MREKNKEIGRLELEMEGLRDQVKNQEKMIVDAVEKVKMVQEANRGCEGVIRELVGMKGMEGVGEVREFLRRVAEVGSGEMFKTVEGWRGRVERAE